MPEPFAFLHREPAVGVHEELGHHGLSMRDYFAGQTLAGILDDPDFRPSSTKEQQHLAMRVYQMADAMLAERNRDALGASIEAIIDALDEAGLMFWDSAKSKAELREKAREIIRKAGAP